MTPNDYRAVRRVMTDALDLDVMPDDLRDAARNDDLMVHLAKATRELNHAERSVDPSMDAVAGKPIRDAQTDVADLAERRARQLQAMVEQERGQE